MSAKKKSRRGSKLICRLLNARRIAKQITYQALANAMGLHSQQHAFRLCHGELPVQHYHVKILAKALDWDETNLLLLWNISRLLDERVPDDELAILLPGTAPTRQSSGSGGDSRDAADPHHGIRRDGDARLPRIGALYGDAPFGIDLDLLVRLIRSGPNLFPVTEESEKAYQFRRLAELIGKLVLSVIVAPTLSLVLIRKYLVKRFLPHNPLPRHALRVA